MTTAVDTKPTAARLVAVATAGYLPTAPTPLRGTQPKNKMKHPKYVVCKDTGSAIKGENRLDFYTGSYGLKSKANIFGSSASDLFKMFGNKSCHPNKTFRAIRHSDPEWQTAAGAIAAAIQRGLATSSKSAWLTEATR